MSYKHPVYIIHTNIKIIINKKGELYGEMKKCLTEIKIKITSNIDIYFLIIIHKELHVNMIAIICLQKFKIYTVAGITMNLMLSVTVVNNTDDIHRGPF